jgi:RNA polymerase sigma-70 factor (ECF subfamily)
VGDDDQLRKWFCASILPLEPALTRFLRRNWRNQSDIPELRQEIYARVFEGASLSLPLKPKAYLFTAARNYLITLSRRAQVVSIELGSDFDRSSALMDAMTPERHFTAREELNLMQSALARLPPRCRQVVLLRKIEGLSQRDTAERLGVSVSTIEQDLASGMRALVDALLGGDARPKAGIRARRSKQGGWP